MCTFGFGISFSCSWNKSLLNVKYFLNGLRAILKQKLYWYFFFVLVGDPAEHETRVHHAYRRMPISLLYKPQLQHRTLNHDSASGQMLLNISEEK
jgi:hypothetical protein